MFRSLLISLILFSIGSNAQIKLTDPAEMMAVEQRLVNEISKRVKLKNSHFHAIARELESYCEEDLSLCGKESKQLLKKNAADFKKISNLIDDRDAQRGLIEAMVNLIFGGSAKIALAAIDIIFLLVMVPVNLAPALLQVVADLTLDFGELAGEFLVDLAKPRGLVYNAMNSIKIWSKILGIDEYEMEENDDKNDRRLSLRRKSYQKKKEMLTTIVIYSTYGYLSGGEDSLSSAQYGTSAYSEISN